MTKTTKVRPSEKMDLIQGFMKLINNKEPKKKVNRMNNTEREYDCAQKIKDDWGLSFNGFKTLTAKVLPTPTIEFQGGNLYLKI